MWLCNTFSFKNIFVSSNPYLQGACFPSPRPPGPLSNICDCACPDMYMCYVERIDYKDGQQLSSSEHMKLDYLSFSIFLYTYISIPVFHSAVFKMLFFKVQNRKRIKVFLLIEYVNAWKEIQICKYIENFSPQKGLTVCII